MALGLTAPSGECQPGHFCPPGSIHPTDYPCPPGTYTDSSNLTCAAQCTECPPGMFCASGTGGDSSPPLPCFSGHFCPLGTSRGDQHPCPPGTFSPSTNLSDAAQCTGCPPGYACGGGSGSTSSPCSAGYYCPPNTIRPDDYPCPPGTFSSSTNLSDVAQCTQCPPGSWCPLASSAPKSCPAGSYSDRNGSQVRKPVFPINLFVFTCMQWLFDPESVVVCVFFFPGGRSWLCLALVHHLP